MFDTARAEQYCATLRESAFENPILLAANRFGAVVHFRGLGGSRRVGGQPPLEYFDNIARSVALVECLAEVCLRAIPFCSSATEYGNLIGANSF